MVEGCRPACESVERQGQLLLEIIALHEALVSLRQLRQRRNQRLGDKEATVSAELDCGYIGYLTLQRITGLYVLLMY